MNTSKIAYKPVGLALGAASGLLAGAVFKQVWKMLGHDGESPDATDEDRDWGEVLLAAVLQGAIFAGVKATVNRVGAAATRPSDRHLAGLTSKARGTRGSGVAGWLARSPWHSAARRAVALEG